MTPEERAEQIARGATQYLSAPGGWSFDTQSLAVEIAAAIRAAVAEERESIAGMADAIVREHREGQSDANNRRGRRIRCGDPGYWCEDFGCGSWEHFAVRIRARSALMGAHTPGPWRITPTDALHRCSLGAGLYVSTDDGPVAFTSSGSHDDARLIAAAPTLLAALRALVDHIDKQSERLSCCAVLDDAARTAIRLATREAP